MNKINKKYLIIVPILMLISATLIILKNEKTPQFYLEDKYYEESKFIDTNAENLNELIKNKESFVLFIYQPACVTSSNFEKVLNEFLKENTVQIYKIAFSNIKQTNLSENIKYYPSFAIFNKGNMVDYLDANRDDDLKYYETKEEFKNWFTNYVLLKQNSNQENQNQKTSTNTTEGNKPTLNEITLENVTYDENKVNIYLFYGSTCPVCKNEFAFFDEIKEEYGDYYNLYTYEVWENANNNEIMHAFANTLNDELTGVPYNIIGDTSFIGFSENSKQKFIDTITENHQNSNDVYFNSRQSEN